jgi:hypothetical protein
MTTTANDLDVAALLDAIRVIVREELRAARRAEPIAAVLLPVLASVAGSRCFTAREVIAHANVEPSLRDALGVSSARRLGKYFRSIEGRKVNGFQLERIGAERDGLLWIVRVCECDPKHA